MSVRTQTTAEDLFNMPEDGFRYELVNGELRKMTPAGSQHGAIVAKLTAALVDHAEAHNLGEVFRAETGFRLARDPDTVLAPDIAFVARGRIASIGLSEKFWSGPPDLAVEVLSPSDTVYGSDQKIEQWLSAGTQAVWVVNPKRKTVTVYSPQAEPQIVTVNDLLEGQGVLPGFRYSIVKMFPKD